MGLGQPHLTLSFPSFTVAWVIGLVYCIFHLAHIIPSFLFNLHHSFRIAYSYFYFHPTFVLFKLLWRMKIYGADKLAMNFHQGLLLSSHEFHKQGPGY